MRNPADPVPHVATVGGSDRSLFCLRSAAPVEEDTREKGSDQDWSVKENEEILTTKYQEKDILSLRETYQRPIGQRRTILGM